MPEATPTDDEVHERLDRNEARLERIEAMLDTLLALEEPTERCDAPGCDLAAHDDWIEHEQGEPTMPNDTNITTQLMKLVPEDLRREFAEIVALAETAAAALEPLIDRAHAAFLRGDELEALAEDALHGLLTTEDLYDQNRQEHADHLAEIVGKLSGHWSAYQALQEIVNVAERYEEMTPAMQVLKDLRRHAHGRDASHDAAELRETTRSEA